MIDVSQWRASIGLWNYCQAASSRPANGRQCHSFKGAVDSKPGSIPSVKKTTKLPAAIPIITLFLLYHCYPIPPPPPTGIDNFYLLVLPGATAVGSGSNLCFFLFLIVRLLLLLSGDVELNPGPTIDDRPDVSLLIQWLDPLVDWIPFVRCLPGVKHHDISKIVAENRKVDDQKLALYSKWLDITPNATWKDVITALNIRRENKLVQNIKENLQKHIPNSDPPARGQTVTVQEKVMFETAEDEKEILHKLIELNKTFSSLITHVRSGLDKKNESDPKLLANLAIWIKAYMDWNDKLTTASLDETFKIIHPFYDFIDCALIVDMSRVFLKDFIFGDNNLNIVSELQKYNAEADELRASAKVKHLNEALKAIYEEHIPDVSNMPTILVTLHNPWQVSSINGLSLLIHNLLPVGLQQSLMKYITIRIDGGGLQKSIANLGDSFTTDKGLKENIIKLSGLFTTDKGLKESITKLDGTCINMHGPPGSGKTCTQCLLLNEAPPKKDITDSTPIACRAIKATRADAHDDTWQRIDDKAMLERLKFDLQKETYSAQKESTDEDDDDEQQTESRTEVNTSSSITSTSTITHDISEAKSTATSSANDLNVTRKEIVELLSKVNATTTLSDHMMYIIDSGGQPAFQELMPLFTRRTSLNIITINLDHFKNPEDQLSCHFRHDGENFLIDSDIKTYREFVKKAICSSTSSEEPPQCFVLGTHKDKVKNEDIEKAEEVLMSILKSLSEEQQSRVIKPGGPRSEKIIYPINAICEVNREIEARELCATIKSCFNTSAISIPTRWFAFELFIQREADNGLLETERAFSIGRDLYMDKANTEDALKYLHEVTIIFYYPEVLPVIFVDPQPILNILSNLLALTYVEPRHRNKIAVNVMDYEVKNLANNGIFKADLVEKLALKYSKFPKSDFIKILLHLHIIAEIKEELYGGYYIPCALRYYDGPAPKTTVKPLLILWCEAKSRIESENTLPVPHGVFPLTVVHLINQNRLKFLIYSKPLSSTSKFLKHRDAMSFRVSDNEFNYIGTVHIINKYKHIEVYFTDDKLTERCPIICEVVTEAIKYSCKAVKAVPYKLAFTCPQAQKEKEEDCYCIIIDEKKKIANCTNCDASATLEESYWVWFNTKTDVTPHEPKHVATLSIKDVHKVFSRLKKSHFPCDKWNGLGLALGIVQTELDAIKSNNPNNVEGCLIDCLSLWLQQNYDTEGCAKPTMEVLAAALKEMGLRAVASEIMGESSQDSTHAHTCT